MIKSFENLMTEEEIEFKNKYYKKLDDRGYAKLTKEEYYLICDFFKNTIKKLYESSNETISLEDIKKNNISLTNMTTYNVLYLMDKEQLQNQNYNVLFPVYHVELAFLIAFECIEKMETRTPKKHKKIIEEFIEKQNEIANFFNSSERFFKTSHEKEEDKK